VASRAVDGDNKTESCTLNPTPQPWWSIDLGEPMDVDRVIVTNDHNKNLG